MSTPAHSTPNEGALSKQGEQRVVQEETPNVTREVQQGMKPVYLPWPTSKRGPQITTPPLGQRSINALRAEQVVEVGYNQVTGEPGTQDPSRAFPDEAKGPTGTDQQETAQDIMRRGKERL
ncbi:MAG: hypothetical protein NVS4B1_02110 [Ktedonobacteraceae bacterium]